MLLHQITTFITFLPLLLFQRILICMIASVVTSFISVHVFLITALLGIHRVSYISCSSIMTLIPLRGEVNHLCLSLSDRVHGLTVSCLWVRYSKCKE